MRLVHSFVAVILLASPFASAQQVAWSVDQGVSVMLEFYAGCSNGTKAIAALPDGDIIVTGCAANGGEQDYNIITARISGVDRHVVWRKSFMGGYPSRNFPNGGRTDGAYAVVVDGAGDVIVTGYSLERYQTTSMRTIKYRGTTGELLWTVKQNAPDGIGSANGVSVAVDPTGDVFVTGDPFFMTAKISGTTGAVLWSRPLEFLGQSRAVIVDAQGNPYVVGWAYDASDHMNLLAVKLDGATGTPSWTQHLNGFQSDGTVATFDASGDVVVGGSWTSFGINPTAAAYAIKFSAATGATLWSRTLAGDAGSTSVSAIAAAADGDVFVGARGGATGFGRSVMRLAGSDGVPRWTINEPSGSSGWVGGLAVDAAGDVAAAGAVHDGNAWWHEVAKYRGADGQRLWAADTTPGSPGSAWPRGVVVDAAGNVIVARDAIDIRPSMRLEKYAGPSGTLVWSRGSFPVVARQGVSANQLSKVASGRIASVSSIYGSGHGPYSVELHDTASGARLWGFGYEVGGVCGGASSCVEIAPDGDVVMAIGAFDTLEVRKHAAADGGENWIYAASEWPSSYPVAMAMHANGDVAVSGYACEPDGPGSCTQKPRIWKVHGGTGQLAWQAQHADNPAFIASDAAGNTVVAGWIPNFTTFITTPVLTKHGSDGAVLWTWSPSGETQSWSPAGVAVDAAGDLFFLQSSGSTSLRISKHASGTGTPLWTVPVMNASYLVGEQIVLMPGGDVAIVAHDGSGWRFARVSGADGAVRWQRSHPTPTSSMPRDLVVDPDGNLAAVGLLYSEPIGNTQARFMKVHGPSGALLSDLPMFPGITSEGSAISVDAAGSFYVASTVRATGPIGPPETARLVKLTPGPTKPPAFISTDFDSSGGSDLLFANTDGRAAIWLMNGTAVTATAEIIGAGTGWSVSNVADFNGDGKADLVWRHEDGRIAIYLMNGTAPSSTLQLLNAGGWSVAHTPDLNGDGKADLVFQHTDGTIAVWTMDGTTMTGGSSIMGPGTGWSVIRTADFDGDGMGDLLLRHTDGRHAIWLMNGTAIKSTAQILNAGDWTATHTPDLNGDGKADLVWQHTDGTIAVWLMNGTAMASGTGLLNAGAHGWSVTRVGDFDGDGKSDLFFLNADGRAAIYLMNGTTPTQTTQILNAGGGWRAKRLVDLNGDGKADIVWQNVDGSTAVWLMNGTTMTSGTGIVGTGTGWSVSAVSQ